MHLLISYIKLYILVGTRDLRPARKGRKKKKKKTLVLTLGRSGAYIPNPPEKGGKKKKKKKKEPWY